MRSIAVIGITLALAVLLGGCASSGKASRESITNAKVEANAIDLFRFVPHDKSVNWQIEAPVVTAIYNNPQDMKLIAPNRLLLIMDAGWARCPFMIDTDGVLLWVKSLVECSDSIVNNRYCQVETAGIAVHQDMLLVRIQGDGGTLPGRRGGQSICRVVERLNCSHPPRMSYWQPFNRTGNKRSSRC
jgi:hypothetical protein